MGIEGSLNIRLEIAHGAARRVSIESSRSVHASIVFRGKRIAESLQLIPLLFSICATAQACAGVRACEQALGLRAAAETERIRDLLVNMETLREHLWRILLDWPAFIDSEADKSVVAEVYRILTRGGIFMYPYDRRDPSKPGKLRLMYEANPMGYIIEQAGGLASTGRERILDIKPDGIHQRVPVILGSENEVERVVSYHHE